MQIPQQLKVGRKKYTVAQVPRVSKAHVGRVYPEAGLIKIGNDSPNKARTFWHELTHAILHDMKDTRWADEEFVTRFSTRLEYAIRTATFNGKA